MPTDEDIARLLSEAPTSLTSYELLLVVTCGLSLEQARARIKEQENVRAKATKLVNMPVKDWPEFEIQWDLDPRSFYFALDGASPSSLDQRDLAVVSSTLAELDAVLSHQSWRGPDELWTLGDPHKLARVLVHCLEGRPLTPPWIIPVGNEIGLVGGNHRLAVCRAKGVKALPFIVEKHHLPQVSAILHFDLTR
jgi:hypothetical protein